MQHSDAWTKLAPYKHIRLFKGPSDRIASAYTPTSNDITAKNVPQYVSRAAEEEKEKESEEWRSGGIGGNAGGENTVSPPIYQHIVLLCRQR